MVRVAVRGLGRGETAGVGLDGSAGVSSGGASSGMDSESRTVSSSSTMTCGCEEEAELAWGRGGEGIRDAASDKVEWTEASEASDLSESSEVAEGEVSRGGGSLLSAVSAWSGFVAGHGLVWWAVSVCGEGGMRVGAVRVV